MLDTLTRALRLPDLRRKILFTLFIIAIYRLAAHVPVPGVDRATMQTIFGSTSAAGQLTRFLNLLSGGALENFSVMAMGVYPYITASIILQLLTPLIPALEELSKEGESGRNRITQYTFWLTIPLAILQAVAQVTLLNSNAITGVGQVVAFGADAPLNTLAVLASLSAGTMFALWLGERITERGLGNGVSIIIFAGIVAGIPTNVLSLASVNVLAIVPMVIITALTAWLIVWVQEAHRRVPVQYGRRVRGTRTYGGQSTYIPLRINSAGMIPLIFASALMIFPGVIGSLITTIEGNAGLRDAGFWLQNEFASGNGGIVYYGIYFVLVVAFTFFYTDTVFRQQALHESLQRNGGFVPGIRPGKRTEDYLNFVMHRITLAGAIFLGAVAILPYFAQFLVPGSQGPTGSLLVDATGLLIVVGVVLDTIKQLEAQLLMRNYEGFIR